jgi:Na+-driven multidrug efflux pump
MQPLLSTYYGKNRPHQIRKIMSYGQAAMMMLSAGMYGVLFVFAPQVTSVFNSEGNEVLQRIAEIGLKLYFTSNIFLGFNTVAATFFTSVEKALPAHVLSLLRGFVLIIPLAFIMSVLWGMNGIWLCFPVTEAITAVLGFFIYRKILKDFQV